MTICRTCLKTPANRSILELEKVINNGNKNYLYIMLFCLDIKVTEDSNITTNLCFTCYRKIISFYNFKELSLKNDAYLKYLDTKSLKGNKIVVSVDANDIKNENCSDSDDFPLNIEAYVGEVKPEPDVKKKSEPADTQSDDELLSVVKKVKYKIEANRNNDETKENVNLKKLGGSKNIKPLKVGKKKTKKQQVCEECGKSVCNLKEHSLLHQSKAECKKWQCQLCDKEFNSSSGRKKHYRIKHLGAKKKCDICNKEVVCLSQHKRVVHNTSQLPFSCEPCGRRFISQSALDAHLTAHSKDRPHECDVCQKTFKTKQYVGFHKRQVHVKERKFLCQFCSKAFFTKQHLIIHLRSHTKEKPYECPDCGKRFSTSSILRNHKLTHSDLKPFQCQLCDMNFAKSDYLKAHMISHTRERPYPCRFCSVGFGRSDHRKRHEWTAHQKHLVSTPESPRADTK